MKRIICIFMIALFVLSISACGFYQTPTAPAQTHAAMTEDLKVLLEADPELMDLMKMDAEMDNLQIITILGDATSPDDDTAEDAREVVDALNLTLPVYLVNEEIMELLPFNAFPTSFLVDREGNPLGAACVGAVGTEKYQTWIQSCIGG